MGRAAPAPRRLAAAVLLLALVVALLPTRDASAADEPRPVERVLVLAIPDLLWSDLSPDATPALWSLLEDSAVANLSMRIQRRASKAGDAYATIGAGTRAVAAGHLAGVALAPDEPYGMGDAGEEFGRRTGTEVDGVAGLLTLPSIVRQNEATTFGGDIGRVGEELLAAGWTPAVVANADRLDTDGPSWHREAAIALVDRRGVLAAGHVGPDLLVRDPTAPGGAHLDPTRVLDEVRAAWAPRAVVLVELSDLRRVETYSTTFTGARRRAEHERALTAVDDLARELLARTDPERDAVLVVAPENPSGPPRLTVAALRAPGVGPERLESGQTRRPGYVTITDVGPTLLDLAGIEPPATMEGRPFVPGGGEAPLRVRIDGLRDDEAAARFRDSLVRPVTNAVILANVALALAAAVVTWRGGRRVALLRAAASSLVAVLPLTYLAGLLPFPDLGAGWYWAYLVVGSGTVGVAASVLGRRRPLVALGALLGGVIAVICTSVVLLDSDLQFNTVFGDSPIVAGRFGGVNNVTFAQLFAAAIVLAALVAHRPGGRRGRIAAIGLLGGVLVVDVMPFWGADVGGILAGVPAMALTGALLLGLRVRVRTAIGAGVATAAAVGALVLVDLSRPSAQRSHLGRLVERIGDDGSEGLTLVVQRKLEQNVAALGGTLWVLLVVAVAALAAYLWIATPGAGARVVRRIPPLRAAAWGLLVTGVLGMALNDSGVAVPGMALAVALPSAVVVLTTTGWPVPASPGRWRDWWEARPRRSPAAQPAP